MAAPGRPVRPAPKRPLSLVPRIQNKGTGELGWNDVDANADALIIAVRLSCYRYRTHKGDFTRATAMLAWLVST